MPMRPPVARASTGMAKGLSLGQRRLRQTPPIPAGPSLLFERPLAHPGVLCGDQ